MPHADREHLPGFGAQHVEFILEGVDVALQIIEAQAVRCLYRMPLSSVAAPASTIETRAGSRSVAGWM